MQRNIIAVVLCVLLLIFLGYSLLTDEAGVPALAALKKATPTPEATPVPTAVPTPTPTPTPTLEPTPTPTPSPTPVPPVGDAYYDAFFNNAVFLGDSIMGGLRNYAAFERDALRSTYLGDAQIYASTKCRIENLSNSQSKRFLYSGHLVSMRYLLKKTQPEKVFIMLGMNNWAGAQIEKCIVSYRKAIETLRSINPDIQIYIQSCTPVVLSGETEKVNNENLDAFNKALQELCLETDVHYIDISTPLKGEDNAMVPSYSSDGFVHLTAEGSAKWAEALYQFAYDAHLKGLYQPDEP